MTAGEDSAQGDFHRPNTPPDELMAAQNRPESAGLFRSHAIALRPEMVPVVLKRRPMETLTWDAQRHFGRAAAMRVIRAEDARQAPLVLAIFFVTQLLDGSLTYWGVTRFGIHLEMNSLLAATMHQVGPFAALVGAKGLACACGLILYTNAYWRSLAAMAGLCLGVAVVPWLAMAAWVSAHSWI